MKSAAWLLVGVVILFAWQWNVCRQMRAERESYLHEMRELDAELRKLTEALDELTKELEEERRQEQAGRLVRLLGV
jgi:hypothetical protein